MTREHSAALAVLDKIAGYSWSINEYGRALVALPELAALYREGVEFEAAMTAQINENGAGGYALARLADFRAALAAVADALTQGEVK